MKYLISSQNKIQQYQYTLVINVGSMKKLIMEGIWRFTNGTVVIHGIGKF